MKKDDKPIQVAQGSSLSFRHKRILASDERILKAHQGAGNGRKMELFGLRELRQGTLAV